MSYPLTARRRAAATRTAGEAELTGIASECKPTLSTPAGRAGRGSFGKCRMSSRMATAANATLGTKSSRQPKLSVT
jgi:hypothetical protein